MNIMFYDSEYYYRPYTIYLYYSTIVYPCKGIWWLEIFLIVVLSDNKLTMIRKRYQWLAVITCYECRILALVGHHYGHFRTAFDFIHLCFITIQFRIRYHYIQTAMINDENSSYRWQSDIWNGFLTFWGIWLSTFRDLREEL